MEITPFHLNNLNYQPSGQQVSFSSGKDAIAINNFPNNIQQTQFHTIGSTSYDNSGEHSMDFFTIQSQSNHIDEFGFLFPSSTTNSIASVPEIQTQYQINVNNEMQNTIYRESNFSAIQHQSYWQTNGSQFANQYNAPLTSPHVQSLTNFCFPTTSQLHSSSNANQKNYFKSFDRSNYGFHEQQKLSNLNSIRKSQKEPNTTKGKLLNQLNRLIDLIK